ncbi:MAG: DUF2892 domain-containing protein [Bacteroidetes bacterium]|nr:DUF2892 domain-containing protein [Bacteroidota bacterium]
MKKNMGATDRIMRFLAAAIIIVLYLTKQLSGTAAIVLLVFAVVFILTSFMGFCPLYYPFGINTCKKKTNES